MKLAVKPFTMVGATTRSGLLSSPLRDRFGQHYHLEFYTHSELAQIIQRSADLLAVRIDSEGALELAARSRGTPRIANRLLRRVRDFAQINELSIVTREVALGASELLEIDACGFDKMDRAILAAIIDKFDGGPVGVETLAAAVGEESDTIGDVYEPYLLQEGFIARTARSCCHAACVHTFGPCPPRHVAVGHSSHDSQTLFLRNVTELHVRRFADRKRDSSANCGGVWAVLST